MFKQMSNDNDRKLYINNSNSLTIDNQSIDSNLYNKLCQK